MKISVIVPMFNETRYIDIFLTSFQNQTRIADEIVICDNLSTDDSVKMIKQWQTKHKNLNIILTSESKKGGVKFPTQKAFEKSTGDIILRTDFDAELPKDWIEKYEKLFTSNPDAMAISGVWFSSDGRWYHKLVYYIAHGFTSIYFKLPLTKYKFLFGPNSGFRREALENVKAWKDVEYLPHGWTEDLMISKKFELANLKCKYFFSLIIKHSSRNIQRKNGVWYMIKNQFKNEEYLLRKI